MTSQDRAPVADCLGHLAALYSLQAGSMRRSLALAALSLGVLVSSLGCSEDRSGSAYSELAEGLRSFRLGRLFEPRLTIDLEHHPCSIENASGSSIPRLRCAELPSPDASEFAALDRLSKAVHRNANQRLSAADLQGRALWDMLWYQPSAGRSERLDKAILGLRGAASAAGSKGLGVSLSDLGAAYILRAQRDDATIDLILALSATLRAIESDPDLVAARFNLALTLTHLRLRRAAAQAWHEVLALASDGPWAEEARAHYKDLSSPSPAERWADVQEDLLAGRVEPDPEALGKLVALCPQCVREFVLETLLAAWATIDPYSQKGERWLDLARMLGEILLRVSSDAMALDVVQVVDQILAGGDEDSLELLRCGHRAYSDGRQSFDGLEMVQAASRLRDARQCLASVGSPLVHWADVWLAGVSIADPDYSQAQAIYDHVLKSVEPSRYPTLEAKIHWGWIHIDARQGRYAAALERSEAAIQLFRRADEAANQGAMFFEQAAMLDLLGRPTEAWRSRHQALSQLSRYPVPRRLHNLLLQLADTALEAGLPRAALLLQTESVWVATERSEDPQMAAEALLWRSKIHHQLGDWDAATADLEMAREFNALIPDPDTRERNLASLRQATGEVLAVGRPQFALEQLDDAITFYEDHELAPNLAATYLFRARVHRALGRALLAEDDLLRALELFQEHRASIEARRHGRSHLEKAQELFDEMISLQASEIQQEAGALYYSEIARRVLPGRPPTSKFALRPEADYPRSELQRLPPGLAVLEYALLEDRLLIWVLDRHGMEMAATRIDSRRLRSLVQRFLDHLIRDGLGRQTAELSSELHGILLGPVLARLATATDLVFIADKFLHRLPFAALKDATSRRLLVEERAVVMSPSFETLLASLDRGEALTPGSASLLAMSPAADWRFDHLPPLPGAAQESLSTAALYDNPRRIDGPAATKGRFLEELPGYQIVQFSGHAVYNTANPDRSYLLFAPEPHGSEDGALYASELLGLELEELRLVILSACGTLTPAELRTEGLSALAQPFLAAGADAVLGTLWPVDDDASRRLLIAFHESLTSGQSPARALRQAQRQLIDHPDPWISSPRTWAAFQLVGTFPIATADN